MSTTRMEDVVEGAARVTGQCADHQSDEHCGERAHKTDGDRHLTSIDDPGKEIPAEGVRAEKVAPLVDANRLSVDDHGLAEQPCFEHGQVLPFPFR